MSKLTVRSVFFLIPMLGLLLMSCSTENPSATQDPGPSAGQLPGSSEEVVPGSTAAPVSSPATALPADAETHRDHNPKHGGTFFMALDNKHHLEGVLLPPGIFCVYLYDARTQPLGHAELHQASGAVQWGDSDGAPETLLAVDDDAHRLETALGQEVEFPLTLTLLLRLPGSPPDAKPELFTFPFSHYSEQTSDGHGPPHSH